MVNPTKKKTNADEISPYNSFRILVIGRANAGKTTLLKHVCNTHNGSEAPVYHKYLGRRQSIKPTDGRGIHDINQSFHFPSNPRFVFHDSPGFETGDETQLQEVQKFISERSKARRANKQLHVIWFCLVTNASRPLLELEKKFFNEERPDNVPVIAIFTKFDDLVTQIFDPELGLQENQQVAEQTLEKRFKAPLLNFNYPPKACLSMEAMHKNTPSCHAQINKLMEATVNALDDLTLKKLFLSIQRVNLELCLAHSARTHLSQPGWLRTEFYGAFGGIFSWFPHSSSVNNLGHWSFLQLMAEMKIKFFLTWIVSSKSGFKKIEKIFIEEFPESKGRGLNIFESTALLICAENSFWRCSLGVPFLDALHQSLQEYKISESRSILEEAIRAHTPCTLSSSKSRADLVKLIQKNCLPRPAVNNSV